MPKPVDLAIKKLPRIESDSAVIDALQLMQQNDTTSLLLYDDNVFKGPICRGNLSGYPLTRLLMDCPCSPFIFINDNETLSTIPNLFQQAGDRHIVVKDNSGEPLGLIDTSFLITALCNQDHDLYSAPSSSYCKAPKERQNDSHDFDPFSDKIASLETMATVGQISAGIAHDANNLLGTIMGHTELALLKCHNDPSKKHDSNSPNHLKKILSAVNQCTKLLFSLVSISKPSNVPISAEIVNVHELYLDTISLLRSSMHSNVSFSCHLDAIEPKILCVKSRLMNAFINLFLNAQDALSSGGNIELTTSNIIFEKTYSNTYGFSITEGSYIVISISDDGKGIPPEFLPQLFQPFFTTKAKGSGLGLSNVFQIITELHGLIDVNSIVDSGTTFKIYIPNVPGYTEKEGTQ